MDRELFQVGRSEHDVDFAAIEQTADPAGDAGGESGRFGNWLYDFDEQVDIAAARRVVEPGAEEPHRGLRSGQTGDDGTDTLDLGGSESHVTNGSSGIC